MRRALGLGRRRLSSEQSRLRMGLAGVGREREEDANDGEKDCPVSHLPEGTGWWVKYKHTTRERAGGDRHSQSVSQSVLKEGRRPSCHECARGDLSASPLTYTMHGGRPGYTVGSPVNAPASNSDRNRRR
jgi:hypothetical protein